MSNTPRTAVVRSVLAQVALAAFLAVTLGCAESSPAAPTLARAPATPAGVYTITASTNTVAPGGQLSVSWTASPGGPADCISLFKKGDSNTAYGWAAYTEGATSGTSTLSAPTQSGQYEFRYLLFDGLIDVARSRLVTVAAAGEENGRQRQAESEAVASISRGPVHFLDSGPFHFLDRRKGNDQAD